MGNAASILGDVSKTAHEILKHFPIRRVGSVEPSPFPQLVTGRICGLVHYMVAPVNNKPCVWHSSVAKEEGGHAEGPEGDPRDPELRFKEGDHYVDFYLADPSAPGQFLIVPASAARVVALRGEGCEAASGQEWFGDTPIPPNIQAWADRHRFALTTPGALYGVSKKRMHYLESSFDINEQVAVMGIVAPGVGPTGQVCVPRPPTPRTTAHHTHARILIPPPTTTTTNKTTTTTTTSAGERAPPDDGQQPRRRLLPGEHLFATSTSRDTTCVTDTSPRGLTLHAAL